MVIKELQSHASDADAATLGWFFKTGPGEYGEGDQFIGVKVPVIRKIAKEYRTLSLDEVKKLIESPIHEHRATGLIILTLQYPKAANKQAIFELYIEELRKEHINNWDQIGRAHV